MNMNMKVTSKFYKTKNNFYARYFLYYNIIQG